MDEIEQEITEEEMGAHGLHATTDHDDDSDVDEDGDSGLVEVKKDPEEDEFANNEMKDIEDYYKEHNDYNEF